MWVKNGLKAQKLLAQGIALGIVAVSKAPCKGKSLINFWYLKAFALTGRQGCVHNKPRAMPWARSFCPLPFPSAGDRWFRACGVHLQ